MLSSHYKQQRILRGRITHLSSSVSHLQEDGNAAPQTLLPSACIHARVGGKEIDRSSAMFGAISEQVKDVIRVVEDIENDVMLTSLDYAGKANSHVAGYSVQVTRK